MQMIKKESGITMLVLVITIIILAIISTILINYSVIGTNESKDKKLLANLEAVQHAVYERAEQYKLTEDESLLIGSSTNKPSQSIDWEKGGQYWSSTDRFERYYTLNESQLKQLGVDNTTANTYIVNYCTGEVYDKTNEKTSTGKILYIK